MRLASWEIVSEARAELPSDIIRVKQVHGAAIVWASAAQGQALAADGIAAPHTFMPAFMISTADCLPLAVVSDEIACVVHISRKTLIRGILETIPNFIAPHEMRAAYFGPHVCAEHFVFEQVGSEIAAFQQKFPFACQRRGDGLHLDINAVVTKQLINWGLPPDTLQRDGRCTFADETLPSYIRAWRSKQPLNGGIATIVRRSYGS